MDWITTHWAAYPRQFPAVLPAQHTGYLPAKREWVDRAFPSCNFSLILSGAGEFHRKGVRHEVLAPCVITQWPGEHVRYGPADGSTWEEFFVIYSPAMSPHSGAWDWSKHHDRSGPSAISGRCAWRSTNSASDELVRTRRGGRSRGQGL